MISLIHRFALLSVLGLTISLGSRAAHAQDEQVQPQNGQDGFQDQDQNDQNGFQNGQNNGQNGGQFAPRNGAPRNGAAGAVPPGLAGTILTAERNQDADSLLLAYGQAVTDPNLARSAIAQLLSSYYLMRNQAQTADQATQAVAEANLRFQVLQAAQNQVMIQQNQQLIEQNTQIIALLRGRTPGR